MNRLIAAFAAALIMTAATAAYSDSVCSDLQNNIVRLHIIANSDSDMDQTVKLKVRDAVIEKFGTMDESGSASEYGADIENHLGEIEEIADDVLKENGFSYTAKASYGKFRFPKKEYKSLTLPSGDYYGVRVELGSGEGHNWWCVMYPPLCFTEDDRGEMSESSDRALMKTLDRETYDIISGGDMEVRFKVVELAQEVYSAILAGR